MFEAAAVHMADRGFCDSVDGAVFERPALVRGRDEVRAIVSELLEAAQAAGEIRPDFMVDDVPIVLLGVARAAPRDSWRRYLGFALDGLRPVS
jgi:hypothetical protein